MVLNLMKDIKKIKVTADPNSYSTFIYGHPKIGKSTLVKNLYGDRVLILETEPRDRALVGANVAHVNNWIDFISALNQLKNSKELHKRFDVVAIDTVDNIVRFVEDYAKQHFDEKELGENASFGKDYNFAKDQYIKYVTSIHAAGYTPVYVGHEKKVTVRIPADQATESSIEGADEVREGNKVYYEFEQAQPDLPTKYWNPINKSVDQILYMSYMFVKGQEKRVIHLRDSARWKAGSTFPKIKPVIPDDAKVYRQTLKDAVNHYDKKDQTTADYNKPEKKVDFKQLMKDAKKLGVKLAKAGKADKVKKIVADVFGPGSHLLEANEDQAQEVQAAMLKMRKLV